MSLPAFSTQSELFSTAGISGSLFADTDRYRLFARKVYPALARVRAKLEACYCADNGRLAIEPVLLLGVSLLQYLEAVPDRQAVDLLHYHAGWNFALNRQVGDELFHPTTLVNFRQRLLEHDLSTIGFDLVIQELVAAGLVARQSRQRWDSTQMFGRVSRMSRLDCVRESLRLALVELAEQIPGEARPEWWPQVWERYGDSQADYRAPLETLARKMVEAGTDAERLLGWVASPAAQTRVRGTQAQLLARVFSEQFEVVAGTAAPQPKTKELLSSERVQNPHDPDATYAAKGRGEQKKEHVGYKVQVAETVCEAILAPDEPTRNFIRGIVTHAARESDQEGSQKMALEQQALGMDKPPVQYVDAAYVSTEKLVEAATQGRELIGPALASPHNNEGRFTPEQFTVTVEQRQAVCPAGEANTQCSRLQEQAAGKVSCRFEWSSSLCGHCPLRQQCIKADHPHRTLVVGEHHTTLQARRQEQQTKPFQQRMKHRNAIEGTQSELVRAHGLRHARYRGLSKAKLQNYFIGAACNIKRWLRRLAWELQNTLIAKLSTVSAN
ncbi:MAG: transposase [Verrucomicrobiota bacterium]|jgi:transposase